MLDESLSPRRVRALKKRPPAAFVAVLVAVAVALVSTASASATEPVPSGCTINSAPEACIASAVTAGFSNEHIAVDEFGDFFWGASGPQAYSTGTDDESDVYENGAEVAEGHVFRANVSAEGVLTVFVGVHNGTLNGIEAPSSQALTCDYTNKACYGDATHYYGNVAAPEAPSNTAAPTIAGTPEAGVTLSASTGSWTGYPTPSYGYQWKRCDSSGEECTNVSGATNSTYHLSSSDIGAKLRITVTATNSSGSASSTSSATGAVAAGREPLPSGCTVNSTPEACIASALTAGFTSEHIAVDEFGDFFWGASGPQAYSTGTNDDSDVYENGAELAEGHVFRANVSAEGVLTVFVGVHNGTLTSIEVPGDQALTCDYPNRACYGDPTHYYGNPGVVYEDPPPDCTDLWTGAAGNDAWAASANWSSGTPGSSDIACIESGIIVQVSSGAHEVGRIEDSGQLILAGGTLEVTGSGEASSVASLKVTGGTLSGGGNLGVTGTFEWTEGTLSGSGETVLAATATGTINPFASVSLDERELVNEGSLNWYSGALSASGGAVISNQGTFYANDDGPHCNPLCVGVGLLTGSGSGAIENTSTGKLVKSAGSVTYITVPVDNQGTVEVTTGTLQLSGGGVSGETALGKWATTGEGLLEFEGGTFALGEPTLSGEIAVTGGEVVAGALDAESADISIEGATLKVEGPAVSRVEEVSVGRGPHGTNGNSVLAGPGQVDVSDNFHFEEGKVDDIRPLLLEAGSVGLIDPYGRANLNNTTLINEGVLNWYSGTLVGAGSSEILNEGIFEINDQGPTADCLGCEGMKTAEYLLQTYGEEYFVGWYPAEQGLEGSAVLVNEGTITDPETSCGEGGPEVEVWWYTSGQGEFNENCTRFVGGFAGEFGTGSEEPEEEEALEFEEEGVYFTETEEEELEHSMRSGTRMFEGVHPETLSSHKLNCTFAWPPCKELLNSFPEETSKTNSEIRKAQSVAIQNVLELFDLPTPSEDFEYNIRQTDNKKGWILRKVGQAENDNRETLRLMAPTERYPEGYMVYTNAEGGGQPINPRTGRPGSPSQTHIEPSYKGPFKGLPKWYIDD